MKRAFIFVAFGLVGFVPLAAHATCKSPLAYGAVRNDGQDDRAAFQAAIDDAIADHVDVCIPAGTFDLRRDPGGALYSLRISGPVGITGAGRAFTRLKMLGSGILHAQFPAQWRLVEVQATGVFLADFALDGSNRVDTGEQTHLLALIGPVDDVRVERIDLTLPVLAIPPGLSNCSDVYEFAGTYCYSGTNAIAGFFGGGDCARFQGSSTALVQNVLLHDVRATNCDRAAFSVQRGVDNLLIEDSVGECRDDQALDLEPSSTAAITNVTIRRTLLSRGPHIDGTAFTAAIGGQPNFPVDNVLVEDTAIVGGGLHIINARNVTLNRVALNSGTISTSATLAIEQIAENIQILDSTIIRPPFAPTNNLIAVTHNAGRFPHDVTISGSELEQNTPKNVAFLNSLPFFTMTDSTVVVTAPFSPGQGIVADANQGSMNEVMLTGVDFSFAATETMLKIIGRGGHRVATAFVSNTTATGLSKYGVEYDITGGASPPNPDPVLSGNSFSSPTDICFDHNSGICNP